jgi:hypothetical protein
MPSPEPVDQSPIAFARRRLSANIALMIVRLPGTSSTGPTPCSTRPASSQPVDGARLSASEPAPKAARPSMNMPFRPRRSPSEPPATSSATLTTVVDITARNCDPASTATASHGLAGGAGVISPV